MDKEKTTALNDEPEKFISKANLIQYVDLINIEIREYIKVQVAEALKQKGLNETKGRD